MTIRRLIGLGLGIAALGGLESEPASAQTDARLVAVVKLAQDGLADSARATIKRMLDATQPTDSLFAEMLYTSGLVAATDAERRLALRRVVVEYSQSPWADDAILLLGQTEYANGNPGLTVAETQRLVRDYPTSPLIPMGALWGSRAASDMGNAEAACQLADAGLAAPNEDIELKNQLDYQKQRCSALVAAKADSVKVAQANPPDTAKPKDVPTKPAERPKNTSSKPKAAEPAPAPSPPPPPPPNPASSSRPRAGGFRVQIIAAPTRAAAEPKLEALKAIDPDATIVEEGGFFKVRTGAYRSRAEAQTAMAKIRARLGGQPFVVADK